jgi:hypothetical protein
MSMLLNHGRRISTLTSGQASKVNRSRRLPHHFVENKKIAKHNRTCPHPSSNGNKQFTRVK